jgi:hypothetical protein
MVMALVLSIMSSRSAQPESILRSDDAPAATVAPEPLLPGAEPTPVPDESGNNEDPGN